MKSIAALVLVLSFLGCSQKEKNKILAINIEPVAITFEEKLSEALYARKRNWFSRKSYRP